jgi:anti-sigma factor RsiW
MNREPRSVSTGQMLAYVDACLSPADRAALEERMARSPEVKNQIAVWLAQNEAIRAAFPIRAVHPAPAGGARTGEDTVSSRRRVNLRRLDVARAPRSDGTAAGRTEPLRIASAAASRACRVLAATLAIWAGGAFAVSDARPADLVKTAVAAYRTYAGNIAHPVEMATADRRTLDKWFAAQSLVLAPLLDLDAVGLALLGGRIVPGARSPAGFLLYETAQRERLALQIEPLDSPPESAIKAGAIGDMANASWTAAGHSFVLVGAASGARLAPLAQFIREGESRN